MKACEDVDTSHVIAYQHALTDLTACELHITTLENHRPHDNNAYNDIVARKTGNAMRKVFLSITTYPQRAT